MINPVIARINERNRAWAAEQAIFMEKWLKDPVLLQAAIAGVRREQDRFVPVYNQLPFEAHLAIAADIKAHVLKSRAKRGGSAKKADALQQLIEKLVGRNPDLSERDLGARLNRETYPTVIEDVDEDTIYYKGKKGALKEAPLSGLKDRLSRAKKKNEFAQTR